MHLFFHDIKLKHIIAHRVGNKSKREGVLLSSRELQLESSLKNLLLNYFLDPFKDVLPYYQFDLNEDNLVHQIAKELFAKTDDFFELSCRLAKYQYEASIHPKVKSGEVYIAYFENVSFDGAPVEAIGIFKSENKETYLKIYEDGRQSLEVERQEGINIKKLDKGCLILNTASDDGYRLLTVDKTSPKSDVAKFWEKTYLRITQLEDEYFHTQNYMELCKGFCEEVFNQENDIPKNEQLQLLSRSYDFFCEEPEFTPEKFKEEVIKSTDLVEAFDAYKDEYEVDKEVKMAPSFHIHKPSAINTRKKFRSIIKLDKNFHVYIHGDQEFIERGFDERRKKGFYKLYFDTES